MLKWAKGSKNGGEGAGHQFGSAGRVSLADLRRASAKLLRRKDSSKSSVKNMTSLPASIAEFGSSSPPPLVPPRGSSTSSTTTTTTTTTINHQDVIKQATVRRMSTLRHQTRSASPDCLVKRPGSSSSNSSSSTSSSAEVCRERRRPNKKKLLIPDGDNSSSLYMQLDQIPVAVQHQQYSVNKRKALEDISNQAYRHIIRSLQDELAQLADDETRTLAEATLLPINRKAFDSFLF